MTAIDVIAGYAANGCRGSVCAPFYLRDASGKSLLEWQQLISSGNVSASDNRLF
ncbi:hypothetical protein [Rahnella sikkimica]|uniref:hypothetical protein n=1 Tax=Rahnella sikkimica TaxID=1805933 RepID=UPI0018659EA9|nr:hypothetical protein [Rahnella sikkimica]